MSRFYFSLRVALIVIVIAIVLVTIDWQWRGYIVVADPGERAERVDAIYAGQVITLRNQSGIRHVGRPRGDGQLAITCRGGYAVRRGYITRGTDTIYQISERDCPALARRVPSR